LSREDERIVVAPTVASSEDERTENREEITVGQRLETKVRDYGQRQTKPKCLTERNEAKGMPSIRPRETKSKTLGREINKIKIPKLQADRDQSHEQTENERHES
jgi:hypothetical protein